MQRMRFAWIAAVGAVLAAAVAGAATAAHTSSKDVTLNLVAYSTPRPVLTKLIEEFRKTPQGSGVNIRASYGPSSAQGQAVANGLPADGVILNTGNDINDLVDKGLVDTNWDKQSYNGVVWNSVVVFGLRERQPEEDQGLERPPQARRRGRHRQPVHRRHRQVEHPRRLRRAAAAWARPTSRRSTTCGSSTRTTSSPRTRRDRTRRTRSCRGRATSSSRSRARRSTGRSRTSSRARRC